MYNEKLSKRVNMITIDKTHRFYGHYQQGKGIFRETQVYISKNMKNGEKHTAHYENPTQASLNRVERLMNKLNWIGL